MSIEAEGRIALKKVTGATVTTIIDNYVQVFLPSSGKVERPHLLGEHEFRQSAQKSKR